MVNSLHKKLYRDLKSIRPQAITIGFVIAAGIAYMVGSFAAYNSLIQAQEKFYREGNLSDGFVYLNRAPESILKSIGSLPFILMVESRISQEVSLDFPDEILPSSGLLMNIPNEINKLSLQSGRFPRGNNEVILSEAFAIENNLSIGTKLVAIIKGQRSTLTVTGTALSPEFVYIFRPSSPLPDDKHYGILWMERQSVESSLGMDSAFNQILIKFSISNPNEKKATLQKIDEILKPYGGLGAQDRSKIPSHSLLEDEFKQLRSTAVFLPGIFLAVAAFLLHIITSRIVSKEREQIATLKALGYTNSRILLHYLELISIITLISSIFGILGGYYLGNVLTNLYGTYYKFPNLIASYEPKLALLSIFIGFISGALGAFLSLKKVVKLEPATAMRPPAPDSFSFTSWEKWFSVSNSQFRMILRNFLRRPARTILTILGLSSAVMIMIVGGFFKDTITLMLEIQFERIQRESMSISLFTAQDDSVIFEFLEKEGVLLAEGVRNVPIRIHSANQKKETMIIGISQYSVLRRILDQDYNRIEIPDSGVLINYDFAMRLNIKAGDLVRIEILEGARAEKNIRVAGLVREVLGQGIYMDRKALSKLLMESNAINQIFLKIDPSKANSLINELKRSPKISGFMNKEIFLKTFKDLMERTMESTSLFILFFTSIISIGVVYNTAMIALSERNYELGSLRILGFHLNEVFFILITELSMQVILAIPIGCFLGLKMAGIVINMNDTEVFRFPAVIGVKTYLNAIATIIFTSIVSFIIIYFKLKKMDLLSVLKVRE